VTLVTALTRAAVLCALARVFLGWGEPSEKPAEAPDRDTERETGRAPAAPVA
jgi:hypothetical protein